MPSSELVDRYLRDGVARLAGAFSPEVAGEMATAVWSELERVHGIRRDDRSTWPTGAPSGLGRLRSAGAFRAIGTDRVEDAVTALAPTRPPQQHDDWGGPLVTFPSPGTWRVPTTGWHLDYPVRGAPDSTLALKWLAYLAPVPAGGGGTVAVPGSHRLVARWSAQAPPEDPGRSAAVRDAVFEMLEGPEAHDVPVRVAELSGQPGDVVFMHPHVLHAAAPNHANGPRLMVTGGIYLPR